MTDAPVPTLAQALATYEEANKACPINNPKPGAKFQEKCPRCNAGPSGHCVVESMAAYSLIAEVRRIVKEEAGE